MQQQTLPTRLTFKKYRASRLSSLRTRSEEVLIAIATLKLVATIVDGEADLREVEIFTRDFSKYFALSRRQALKYISEALSRISHARDTRVIDCACDTLNEHLNAFQKIRLFESIAEIIVVDRAVHEGEEYFLDYIARRLNIVSLLESRYPFV